MMIDPGAASDGVPRRMASWRFIAATILLLVVSILCLNPVAFAADGAGAFDLNATDVTILNPDSLQVVGHAHYKVTHMDGATLFEGENRFLDGEYDHEVQRVELDAHGAPPILVSYQHSFFDADGSPESIDALDAKTGTLAPVESPPQSSSSRFQRNAHARHPACGVLRT